MEKKVIDKRTHKALCIIFITILFFSSFYLFFNQAKGNFNSDLLAHINSALSDKAGYSSIRYLFRIANIIAGIHGIALLLSLITVLIPITATWFVMKCFAIERKKQPNMYVIFLIICPICFVSSIYILNP